MERPQIIHSPTGEEMVVLSRSDYDDILNALPPAKLASALAFDDEDDETPDEIARAIEICEEEQRKLREGKSSLVPAEVVHAILFDAINPIRAWRTYKGWSTERLAKKARLARTTVAQMETGKRKGTVAAYQAIAKALGINTIDSLVIKPGLKKKRRK